MSLNRNKSFDKNNPRKIPSAISFKALHIGGILKSERALFYTLGHSSNYSFDLNQFCRNI